MLVFRRTTLDDDTQIAFSRRFGALEVSKSMNPAAGTAFARQSNLDIKTGEMIPAEDRRMVYQLANMPGATTERRTRDVTRTNFNDRTGRVGPADRPPRYTSTRRSS